MKEEIFQFKISLIDSEPRIWRRFVSQNDCTFQELHGIIQEVMGWFNYHMFAFRIKEKNILMPGADALLFGEESPYANEVCLVEMLNRVGQKFLYIYDFSNDWQHEIVFEKRLPVEEDMTFPLCIAGEMACPPEDSGGVQGYYDKLEINQWQEDFDPRHFNIDGVNTNLRKLDW